MSRMINYGDVDVPLIERDWVRTARRLPYRKTYLLKPGDRWHDAPSAETIWEHYVQLPDDAIPAGAVIAREMIDEGADVAVWTECYGRGRVLMSPDLVCVEAPPVLAGILDDLHAANGRRWAGLPDAIAAFPSGVIAMREAKVAGKDRISETQHSFARTARRILGGRVQFAVVEWGRSVASAAPSENRRPEMTSEKRTCLRDPIPEIFDAARYLDAAVSAHLAGQRALADELIRLADMPAITAWTESLWGPGGPWSKPVMRESNKPSVPKSERTSKRMPGKAQVAELIRRDGFHCRFCGIPVVRSETRTLIRRAYPEALRWGDDNRNAEQHAGLQAMWLTYDHLLPYSRGGTSDLDNMVVACQPCNCGRTELTLQEVGLIDPRTREPARSMWDGLERFH